MIWQQVYDPFNNAVLSTLCAGIPVVVLLGGLAFLHLSAHMAAIYGLISALVIAIFVFGMPTSMAMATAGYGALFGLLPIDYDDLTFVAIDPPHGFDERSTMLSMSC